LLDPGQRFMSTDHETSLSLRKNSSSSMSDSCTMGGNALELFSGPHIEPAADAPQRHYGMCPTSESASVAPIESTVDQPECHYGTTSAQSFHSTPIKVEEHPAFQIDVEALSGTDKEKPRRKNCEVSHVRAAKAYATKVSFWLNESLTVIGE
jgi:hypothetical protein